MLLTLPTPRTVLRQEGKFIIVDTQGMHQTKSFQNRQKYEIYLLYGNCDRIIAMYKLLFAWTLCTVVIKIEKQIRE